MIKQKLLILLVLGGMVGVFILNATMTGSNHYGTKVKNVELKNENEKLTVENQNLNNENKKLTAVVDSQATVITETTAQLEKFTQQDEPIKIIPRNDVDDGEKYNLQPIDLPDDEDN